MEKDYASVAYVNFLFGIFCAYWAQVTGVVPGSGSSWDCSSARSRESSSHRRMPKI